MHKEEWTGRLEETKQIIHRHFVKHLLKYSQKGIVTLLHH